MECIPDWLDLGLRDLHLVQGTYDEKVQRTTHVDEHSPHFVVADAGGNE